MNWGQLLKELNIERAKTPIVLPKYEKFKFGDSDEKVWQVFALLSKHFYPIFEFGTFRGKMTQVFALNSPKKVTTIDIGPDTIDKHRISDEIYEKYVLLELVKDKKNIKQLIENTMTYNFKPHYNKYGLIFIDGGHSYDVCMSDSLNAFKMIKKGGIIIWDDYQWTDVKKVITELQKEKDILIIEKKYGVFVKNE